MDSPIQGSRSSTWMSSDGTSERQEKGEIDWPDRAVVVEIGENANGHVESALPTVVAIVRRRAGYQCRADGECRTARRIAAARWARIAVVGCPGIFIVDHCLAACWVGIDGDVFRTGIENCPTASGLNDPPPTCE